VVKVKEEDWSSHAFHTFTADDALWVVPGDGEDDQQVYDFFINVDNKYLRTVQKESPRGEPALMEARFVYGNILLGLALLNDHPARSDDGEKSSEGQSDENGIVPLVGRVTRLVAPVLLPMIDALAELTPEQIAEG
jgi:hypothetical protein